MEKQKSPLHVRIGSKSISIIEIDLAVKAIMAPQPGIPCMLNAEDGKLYAIVGLVGEESE